jgi:6-pyruvoyltetrahydropterin/6-carboxytetrahydropterin synthase
MFEISVDTHFLASHQLVLADGTKESPHEHIWEVTASVSSKKLNDMGIVMDFRDLTNMLENIVAPFDKKMLNNFEYFQKYNTSAEHVAKYIFERLELMLPENVKLSAVSVVEAANSRAKFSK